MFKITVAEIIKNKVYLFLLAFYDENRLPSYVDLSEEIGLSRQTISTKIKELKEEGYIFVDEDGILSVYNPLDISKKLLRKVLRTGSYKLKDIRDLANGFRVKAIDEVWDWGTVYGIEYDRKLRLIGVTRDYETRIEEHCKQWAFLERDNFIVLKEGTLDEILGLERKLVDTLKPEWNMKKR